MWYIVLTKSRQERRAQENLENQGVEVFLPKWHVEKIVRGKRQLVEEVLFPGYLFIQLDAQSPLFGKVRSTFGVTRLLTFGKEPIAIDQRIISDLRTRAEQRTQQQEFKQGQAIELKTGPFKQYQAIFQDYKGAERAVVLIGLLGQQREIVVALEQLG